MSQSLTWFINFRLETGDSELQRPIKEFQSLTWFINFRLNEINANQGLTKKRFNPLLGL